MPRAFKLDHFQPLKPILFWNFSNFSLSYWGAHSYYPRGLIIGSWENFPSPNMDETEGFQCLGHSNWTICSHFGQFCSEYGWDLCTGLMRSASPNPFCGSGNRVLPAGVKSQFMLGGQKRHGPFSVLQICTKRKRLGCENSSPWLEEASKRDSHNLPLIFSCMSVHPLFHLALR